MFLQQYLWLTRVGLKNVPGKRSTVCCYDLFQFEPAASTLIHKGVWTVLKRPLLDKQFLTPLYFILNAHNSTDLKQAVTHETWKSVTDIWNISFLNYAHII